jgi:hypothetical protein
MSRFSRNVGWCPEMGQAVRLWVLLGGLESRGAIDDPIIGRRKVRPLAERFLDGLNELAALPNERHVYRANESERICGWFKKACAGMTCAAGLSAHTSTSAMRNALWRKSRHTCRLNPKYEPLRILRGDILRCVCGWVSCADPVAALVYNQGNV